VRSTFIRKFKASRHPIVRDIWDHLHSLDTFERRFRTPELHKIGRTIWWASKEKLGEEINRLIAYRNDLNRLLRSIVLKVWRTNTRVWSDTLTKFTISILPRNALSGKLLKFQEASARALHRRQKGRGEAVSKLHKKLEREELIYYE